MVLQTWRFPINASATRAPETVFTNIDNMNKGTFFNQYKPHISDNHFYGKRIFLELLRTLFLFESKINIHMYIF